MWGNEYLTGGLRSPSALLVWNALPLQRLDSELTLIHVTIPIIDVREL